MHIYALRFQPVEGGNVGQGGGVGEISAVGVVTSGGDVKEEFVASAGGSVVADGTVVTQTGAGTSTEAGGDGTVIVDELTGVATDSFITAANMLEQDSSQHNVIYTTGFGDFWGKGEGGCLPKGSQGGTSYILG